MCSTEFTHWLVQNCTVCPGGLCGTVTLLSELTALEFNATTCGELETNANFVGTAEESCSILQVCRRRSMRM
jgi:hypothetical protein